MRRNLDVARLRRKAGRHPVLFILHNLGGGTLKHVREMSDMLAAEGIGVLWLQPDLKDNNFAVVSHPGVENLSTGMVIDLKRGFPDAVALIRDLGVRHIHVHHILGFAPHFSHFMKAVAKACGLRYDVTIHDYTFVCPRVTMIDGSGRYCGNVDVARCEDCVKIHGSPAGDISVWFWRASHEDFLVNARRVFVPNIDVKTRLNDFFPTLAVTTREHPEPLPESMASPVVRMPGETLRVAIIGAIGPHKGSLVLLQCAEDAVRRRLPITFKVFGYSDKLRLQELPNVSFSGKYSEGELDSLLVSSRCHLAFFPAVWPETYSYTLSQGWFAGLYPVAFDIGAIAERIRRSGWGHLLPVDMMTLPAEINDALLSITPPSRPDTFSAVTGTHLYRNIWSDYYEMDRGELVEVRGRSPVSG
jgi:glycosyltransferase involved in cell wall biosynthesis